MIKSFFIFCCVILISLVNEFTVLADEVNKDIYAESLKYHKKEPAGKISVSFTEVLKNPVDLSLAYTPGVAALSKLVKRKPEEAINYTARGNLVAVITNETAVLRLGNIGPLAAKSVMKGKVILFKKFAEINSFDIEINNKNPGKLVESIDSLEPTFGRINLEDIKAPDCFYIEEKLKQRLNIPVFHDDQHGTAIVVSVAILNGLKLVNKDLSKVRIVVSGAGAAGIISLELLLQLGLQKENIVLCNSKGVIHKDRKDKLQVSKMQFAVDNPQKLVDVIKGADIFLGVSVGKVLTPSMVRTMAKNPLILVLANPEPEIFPALIKEVRDDTIIATGCSDYPNQVNNVLAFPYVFRGALDVGTKTIYNEMKIAAVKAIAQLAKRNSSGMENLTFGSDYILPKLLDPRLLVEIASAVAKAAIDTGVAKRSFQDLNAYRRQLINLSNS